ncbi:GPI mannosyltransferase 1 [Oleoguttula sp. CCFEE 5521]
MSTMSAFFSRPRAVFAVAIFLRVALLIYGRWQDANSPMKYTDIDYIVFTDAARFISRGRSPYERATYRYTPLLAWLLYPTSWGGLWFESGKALFAAGDVITGWMIYRILLGRGIPVERSMQYASIWLLNPMVANISTRGSSEGLLAVLVVALLWTTLRRQTLLAGALLGLGVHFKIYPFIYAASIYWWLDDPRQTAFAMPNLLNGPRIKLAVTSFTTFMLLNAVMYWILDHRHNFSVYNTVLHLSSMLPGRSGLQLETVAFLPQLFLALIAIPLKLAKRDLAGAMLAQTFTFVTFNKVCTSQYFLWYMVFLPLYLYGSEFMENRGLGLLALGLWVSGQAAWLQQGYLLEFLGNSTFIPGLWLASAGFFGVNCWILGLIIRDLSVFNPGVKVRKSVANKS